MNTANKLYILTQLFRRFSAAPITLTTTGTNGAATLSGTALNIPQYGNGYANNFLLMGA